MNFGDGGDSTRDPTFIFGRNGMGRMAMSGIAKRFDYILVVYADHLSPELRSDIDRRFPIYADKEIILLKDGTIITVDATWPSGNSIFYEVDNQIYFHKKNEIKSYGERNLGHLYLARHPAN